MGWSEAVCEVKAEGQGSCETLTCESDGEFYIDDDGRCFYGYWVSIAIAVASSQCQHDSDTIPCILATKMTEYIKHLSEVIKCELQRYSTPARNVSMSKVDRHYRSKLLQDLQEIHTLRFSLQSVPSFETQDTVQHVAELVGGYFQNLEDTLRKEKIEQNAKAGNESTNDGEDNTMNVCGQNTNTPSPFCPGLCVRVDRGQHKACKEFSLMTSTQTRPSLECQNGCDVIPKTAMTFCLTVVFVYFRDL